MEYDDTFPGPKTHIGARIDPSLKREIVQKAESLDLSISQLVEVLLRNGLQSEGIAVPRVALTQDAMAELVSLLEEKSVKPGISYLPGTGRDPDEEETGAVHTPVLPTSSDDEEDEPEENDRDSTDINDYPEFPVLDAAIEWLREEKQIEISHTELLDILIDRTIATEDISLEYDPFFHTKPLAQATGKLKIKWAKEAHHKLKKYLP